MTRTHEVTNQVPPLVDRDIAVHPALLEGLHREGAGWAEREVRELARLGNGRQAQEWGRLANQYPPVLHTHDRYGNRVDEVEYLPQYHELMRTAVEHGLHGAPWIDGRAGAHVARAAKLMAWGTSDAGHLCPISMTYAVVPALRTTPQLAAQFEPLLTNREYDPALGPPLAKRGLIAGMSMTEKQGGSDVRANTTRAVAQPDGSYLLTGHKWFTSAPMSDLFLTLAQTESGLSCFLVPRVLPSGERNRLDVVRLKDKLGNRSNASSEVELDGTWGVRVGDEGRGIRTILDMVAATRLDCVLGSASLMRHALAESSWHVAHRSAFGGVLADKPLMQNVISD
ncbi:MAG: putative acyl-CoA dehydrogenase, partial [Pseudonocardiales bacterium]|nr:putative acyl-CoA dehydrogenase [Pseudonocardiales bacterium]